MPTKIGFIMDELLNNNKINKKIKNLSEFVSWCNEFVAEVTKEIKKIDRSTLEDKLLSHVRVSDHFYYPKIYDDMLSQLEEIFSTSQIVHANTFLNVIEETRSDFYKEEKKYLHRLIEYFHRDLEIILVLFARDKINLYEFESWITFYQKMIDTSDFREGMTQTQYMLMQMKNLKKFDNQSEINHLILLLDSQKMRCPYQRINNHLNSWFSTLTLPHVTSHYLPSLQNTFIYCLLILNLPQVLSQDYVNKDLCRFKNETDISLPNYRFSREMEIVEKIKFSKDVNTIRTGLDDLLALHPKHEEYIANRLQFAELEDSTIDGKILELSLRLLEIYPNNEIALRNIIFYYDTIDSSLVLKYGEKLSSLELNHYRSVCARGIYRLHSTMLSEDTSLWQAGMIAAIKDIKAAISARPAHDRWLKAKSDETLDFISFLLRHPEFESIRNENKLTVKKSPATKMMIPLSSESIANFLSNQSLLTLKDINLERLLDYGYGLVVTYNASEFGIKNSNHKQFAIFKPYDKESNNRVYVYKATIYKHQLILDGQKRSDSIELDTSLEKLWASTYAVITPEWKVENDGYKIVPGLAALTKLILNIGGFFASASGLYKIGKLLIHHFFVKITNRRLEELKQQDKQNKFLDNFNGFIKQFKIPPATLQGDKIALNLAKLPGELDLRKFINLKKSFDFQVISVEEGALEKLLMNALENMFSKPCLTIKDNLIVLDKVSQLLQAKYNFSKETNNIVDKLVELSVENLTHLCTLEKNQLQVKYEIALGKVHNLRSYNETVKDIKTRASLVLTKYKHVNNTKLKDIANKLADETLAFIQHTESSLLELEKKEFLNLISSALNKYGKVNSAQSTKKQVTENRAEIDKFISQLNLYASKTTSIESNMKQLADLDKKLEVAVDKLEAELKREKEKQQAAEKQSKEEKKIRLQKEEEERKLAEEKEQQKIVHQEKIKQEKLERRQEEERKRLEKNEKEKRLQDSLREKEYDERCILIRKDTRTRCANDAFDFLCNALNELKDNSVLMMQCLEYTQNNNEVALNILNQIVHESLLYNIMKMMHALGQLFSYKPHKLQECDPFLMSQNDQKEINQGILENAKKGNTPIFIQRQGNLNIRNAYQNRNNIMHNRTAAENKTEKLIAFTIEIKASLDSTLKELLTKGECRKRINLESIKNNFVLNEMSLKGKGERTSLNCINDILTLAERLVLFYNVSALLCKKNFTVFQNSGVLLSAMRSCVVGIGQLIKDLRINPILHHRINQLLLHDEILSQKFLKEGKSVTWSIYRFYKNKIGHTFTDEDEFQNTKKQLPGSEFFSYEEILPAQLYAIGRSTEILVKECRTIKNELENAPSKKTTPPTPFGFFEKKNDDQKPKMNPTVESFKPTFSTSKEEVVSGMEREEKFFDINK